MRSTSLAAFMLFGCSARSPAEGPWPTDVCEALIKSPPANEKTEMIEWGAWLDACLRSELVGQKGAPSPLSDDELQTLGRSSSLFCPEGADAPSRYGPCWLTDCPGLPIRVKAVEVTEGLSGGPGNALERGTPPGDGDPPIECLDNATVEFLGEASKQPGGLVARIVWTENRGNWAHCWMAILQPNEGRPEVTWLSPVWRCG